MRKFQFLALWLLLGCATTQPDTRSLIPSPLREVTALGRFSDQDLPLSYRRIEDGPGFMWVLWSDKRMCIVEPKTWIQTHVGDRVSCEWRMPR